MDENKASRKKNKYEYRTYRDGLDINVGAFVQKLLYHVIPAHRVIPQYSNV